MFASRRPKIVDTFKCIAAVAAVVVGMGAASANASEAKPAQDTRTALELLQDARTNHLRAQQHRNEAAWLSFWGNWLDATKREQAAERLDARAVQEQQAACDLGMCSLPPVFRPTVVYVPTYVPVRRPVIVTRHDVVVVRERRYERPTHVIVRHSGHQR